MPEPHRENRHVYLDILKILSCFLVIVNHTNSRIFLSISPSVTWFVSLGYFFASKIAVPVFILCSGAVLLARDEPYGKIMLRALRVLAVLVLFSFIYYFTPESRVLSAAAIGQFFLHILGRPVTNAFWYLYMYLGLLIMLPALRRMVERFTAKDCAYFALWSFGFLGLYPILAHYVPALSYSRHFSIPLMGVYIALFLTGHFLHSLPPSRPRAAVLPAATLAVLLPLQVGLTALEYKKDPQSFLFFDNTALFPTAVSAVCVFWLARLLFGGPVGARTRKTVGALGRLTFGVYLLSDLLIWHLDPVYDFLSARMHVLAAMLLFELILFAAGFAGAALLRLIPGLKRLL